MSQTPKQAALYVRISEDKKLDQEDEGLGVQRQEDVMRAWAESNGWVVAEVYRDNDLSAFKRSVERPEYERMMSDLREGKRDGILCWDTDRLTRQVRQLLDVMELAEQRSILIGTHSGVLDLASAQGQLVTTILGGVAAQESKHKADRIRATLKDNAINGRARGSNHRDKYGVARPFGWTDNTMQTLHPVEAPALQKACTDLIAGKGYRSICIDWNQRDILTSTGKHWEPVRLKDLLMRHSNAGIPQYQGKPLLDTAGQWTPIVDRDIFFAVQAYLSRNGTRTRAARKYALTNILTCGVCGKKLTGGSGRYKCLGDFDGTCSLSIKTDIADKTVIGYVLGRLNWLSGSDFLTPTQSTRRVEIELELAKIQKDRDEVSASDLSMTSRISLLKPLEATEKALRAEAASHTTQGALGALIGSLAPLMTTPENKLSWDKASDNLSQIKQRWSELDLDRQRVIIRALGEYVVQPWTGHKSDRIEIEKLTLNVAVLN